MRRQRLTIKEDQKGKGKGEKANVKPRANNPPRTSGEVPGGTVKIEKDEPVLPQRKGQRQRTKAGEQRSSSESGDQGSRPPFPPGGEGHRRVNENPSKPQVKKEEPKGRKKVEPLHS